MKTQEGVSATANFEENTWTFEMPDGFTVAAGDFAIIPHGKYCEAVNNLETTVANFPAHADIQDMKDVLQSVIKALNT